MQILILIVPTPKATQPLLAEEAEGSTQCNALLSNALHTRFTGELFQHVRMLLPLHLKLPTSCSCTPQLVRQSVHPTGSPYLHLADNEIKYEERHDDALCFLYSPLVVVVPLPVLCGHAHSLPSLICANGDNLQASGCMT